MGLPDNPFSWDPNGGVSGHVTSLTLGSGGSMLPVNDLDEPIELFIPRESKADPPEQFSLRPNKRKWNYHMITLDKNNTAITVQVHPANSSDIIMAYVRRANRPTLTQYDLKFRIPLEINNTEVDECNPPSPDEPFTLFLNDSQVFKGNYYIGLTYLAPPSISVNGLINGDINMTVNYTLLMFTSQCKYWDDAANKWKTDGCHVSIVCFQCMPIVYDQKNLL